MTVGLDSDEFYLIDNWPGEVTHGPNPADWTAISATEDFPLGTKRAIYDDTNNGWATLMYLYYTVGAGTVAVATVGSPCGIITTTIGTAGAWAHVTNDGSDAQLVGPIAIALGTMVTARYGWFWVGGVAPVDTITALDDQKVPSDASPTVGVHMLLADSASVCKFHLAAATDIGTLSAFALADDTTS